MDAQQLTRELVAFVSPSQLSNREVSLFLADQLTGLGFDVELTQYTDPHGVEKFNVAACRTPQRVPRHARGLAYFCHSDVVPADQWDGPGQPYECTEQDGRLYGRGSCDMKGSAACMLAALARIRPEDQHQPIYFVCTADEELAYRGAQQLVRDSQLYREMVQRQTRVLIGEPTELQVVYAHKGICTLRCTSRGEAAHSSTTAGKNANLAMIPFLQELKAIYERTESEPRWQNAEFTPPTMSWNIGLNDHTTAINVKPARSVCTVFYRPLPGIDEQPLIEDVRTAAERHGVEFQNLGRVPAVYTDPSCEFVQGTLQVSQQADAKTVAYGTDAGAFHELNEKLVCGPGSIAQAHTTDEWISLQQLQAGTERYEALVRRWCLSETSSNDLQGVTPTS